MPRPILTVTLGAWWRGFSTMEQRREPLRNEKGFLKQPWEGWRHPASDPVFSGRATSLATGYRCWPKRLGLGRYGSTWPAYPIHASMRNTGTQRRERPDGFKPAWWLVLVGLREKRRRLPRSINVALLAGQRARLTRQVFGHGMMSGTAAHSVPEPEPVDFTDELSLTECDGLLGVSSRKHGRQWNGIHSPFLLRPNW